MFFWPRRKPATKPRQLTAIDVGTTKVCTLMGTLEEEEYFRIIGMGIVPTQGMHKAQVVDLEGVGESVRQSVREAERSSGQSITTAYIGITGSHISSFNTSSLMAVAGQERPVNPADMKRLLGPIQALRMPTGREMLHTIPRSFSLDGQTASRQPVGMFAFRLEAEVHVVTAATNAVRNLIKAVRRAGVEPEDVVLEPLASGEAVLRPVEKEVGIIVVDVGGGTTDIAVFKGGTLWHTAAIGVAGHQVTRDIALGLGVAYEQAEALKLQRASLLPSSNGSHRDPEGNDTLGRQLRTIVACRMEELLRLVWVELGATDLSPLASAGLVLTGGTSKLPGLVEMAQGIFHLPCRIGVPRNISGLVEHLHDPAYATSVGLLFWGARGARGEISPHHRPSSLSRLWTAVHRRLGR